MGKRDGKQDLVKQKKNWFLRGAQKHGTLGKLLLWGKREKPVGFIQFGPISEFTTAQRFYQRPSPSGEANQVSKSDSRPKLPKRGWCITCVAVQSNYRRKGVATRLVRNVLRDLKRRKVKKIDAYPPEKSAAWNQVSVGPAGLWEKCGFESIGEAKAEKGFVMRKKW